MANVAQFLELLLSQDGDQYVFGHEVSRDDANPSIFDCSELIEWACARLSVVPIMPDGSWFQARHCLNHHTLVAVQVGIDMPGALLFRFSSNPFSGGRPSSAHVAVSQGNGRTIEARSTHYGVGQWSANNRGWTHAGLVPGLDYSTPEGDDMNLSKETWQAAIDQGVINGDPVTGANWWANLASQKEVNDGISELIRGLILRGGGGTVDQEARDRLDKLHTI
jgi:hypothetical protein